MKHNPKVVAAFFKSHLIPYYQTEFKFHPTRKWLFDYVWIGCTCSGEFHHGKSCGMACLENARLALEVEGAVWTGGRHTSGAGFVKDMEKYNEASAMGYRLIRCQPKDLLTKATADLIKRTLGI